MQKYINAGTNHRDSSLTAQGMRFHDPCQESKPSIQTRRTYPWDYTFDDKRDTSVPVLEAYTLKTNKQHSKDPRILETPPSNIRDHHRKVTFSLDNPAFYKTSDSYNEKDINSYGRPDQFNDAETGLRRRQPSTPLEEKERVKNEGDRRCCSYRILVIIVIILLLLLLLMASLFVWRMVCCNKENTSPSTVAPSSVPSTPGGCEANPNPIVFTALPQRVQKELDKFGSFLIEQVRRNQSAALSVSIVYGDKVIWEKGLGVLNKTEQPQRSPNSRTLYPCASVTKLLTAVVLFKLINENRVESFYDRVDRYESKFSVKNPFNNHQITLGELATQRSGLQREAPCYPVSSGSTNLCPYDYNTMLSRIKNLTLIRMPGIKPQYSNLAYGLLGRVLFHSFSTSGQDFHQWMTKEVFSKLGMTTSTFTPSNSQKSRMPVGYMDGDYINHIYDWGWLQPAGGLFTSVNDLSKLLIELMSRNTTNRFLSLPLTEELLKPDYIFPKGKTMTGTPWEMKEYDGYIIREKAGYIYGYNSYVAMVPDIRLGISMLCTDCQQKLGSSVPMYFTKIISTFKKELIQTSIKKFTFPPDSKSFIGQFNSTIPTLKRMDVKNQSTHLTLAVNGFDLFFLNYTSVLTFKININPLLDCLNAYVLGVENDIVVFDKPSSSGKSPGFVMYGASVDGRSYFARVN